MNERLQRIAEKVAATGKSLNPVLTEAEVAAFEHRHSVTLPEGFRRFLMKVGNGGDGPPAYGLVPLGRGPKSSSRPEVEYWEQLPDVAKPFPFTEPWAWERGDESHEGSREQVTHGSIFLGTDGCGMDWHLIVTGPESGNIWWITGEGMQHTIPKRGFLRWYTDWLEGVENWWE
jgi:hypothetical protein